MMDVDKLAAVIRRVDGAHKMGAGTLAQAILDSGVLKELDREVEYHASNHEFNRWLDSEDEAMKWKRRGYTIKQRTKAIPAGEWKEVE